ncbi:MAG: FG-GAP-like repeat-containing protein [Thermoplasmatota archaeon]
MMLVFGIPVTAETETFDFQPLAPKPGERSGDYYLQDNPPEFELTGDSSYNYYGKHMKKLDFNGDGIEDLAISAYAADSYVGAVYIYDGSYQITFPRLREDGSSARWKLSGSGVGSGSTYFGNDFYIGDVNGDGYDDVLVGAPYAIADNQSGGSTIYGAGGAFLFYGGPFRDSSGSTIAATNANASFWGDQQYHYFGKAVGLGDMDGDGYDEIFVTKVANWYIYTPGSPWGYDWHYEAYSYYWFGSATFSGNHYLDNARQDFDGRVGGEGATIKYNYGSYFYNYYYNYFSAGNYATGDMDGDGRDEIAFGTPYDYLNTYPGSNSYYIPGSVYVLHPDSGIKTGYREYYKAGNNNYGDWQHYKGPNGYYYVGFPISMYDFSQDGLMDLAVGAPYYNSMVYLVQGNKTYDTGQLDITSSSVYDVGITVSGVSYGGSHAFGDYDGDGKVDIAVGGRSKVYVIENKEYNFTGGRSVTSSSAAMITYHAPSGTQYFADAGNQYYYAGNSPNFPIVLWNRDNKDACDDVFISDYYYRLNNNYGTGKVWGIANYDMFGIGTFRAKPADGLDKDTFFAEHRKYGFVMSAWNKWDTLGTERMVANIHIGSYDVIVEYTQADGMKILQDPLGYVELDPNSYITTNEALSEMFVHFNLTFTLNTREECAIDVDFSVHAQHISYSDFYEEVGHLRNNFKYLGNLETYWVKGDDWIPLKRDSWMPANSEVGFTGMKLIYNGTDTLADGPYYPRNELFHMEVTNNLGNLTIDNSSSGRNFTMMLGSEGMPIQVLYKLRQVGIPENKLLNKITGFSVYVDTDWPTEPPGIQVHADNYNDPNTIVDNDGELFVTWRIPGEYNSGIKHYEVIVNGDESNITIVKSTFAKVFTTGSGKITVSVRAVDRVEHVGEWSSSFIYIDRETLSFSNFYPGPDEWFNTLNPEVGITITDLGGRAVIGNSVEYAVSYDSGATFGEWMSAGFVLNAEVLDVYLEPMLMEGSGNMIMFRAADEAGNILESDTFPVNIDISSVEFSELTVEGETDWEGIWFETETLSLDLGIADTYSGVDAGTLEYRVTTRGRADLGSSPWMPVEGYSSGQTVDVDMDVMFAKGDKNFIQFRARDLLENPLVYSPIFNIWVNTDPVPVISSPEDGAEFSEMDLITFDASRSNDYDGDALTYKWISTLDGVNETIGEGTIEDFERFEFSLGPGDHYITLVAMDGLHEVFSDPVMVRIEEYIFPEWQTAEDKDGDGMPNWYEFEFNLGWDDDSNKDGMYIPTNHGSKSREELWLLLKSDYANKTAQVSTANDFDNDGHTDFEEYLANTDPTDEKDFPLYKLAGTEEEAKLDLLLLIAIIISILLIIVVLALLMLNNMAIKNKIQEEAAKDAENEQALLEQAMLAGGAARLDALKAASEGRPVALAPVQEGAALPAAPMEAEGMTAQPMQAPYEPQPMEAAPAPQPIDMTGGNPPQ